MTVSGNATLRNQMQKTTLKVHTVREWWLVGTDSVEASPVSHLVHVAHPVLDNPSLICRHHELPVVTPRHRLHSLVVPLGKRRSRDFMSLAVCGRHVVQGGVRSTKGEMRQLDTEHTCQIVRKLNSYPSQRVNSPCIPQPLPRQRKGARQGKRDPDLRVPRH